MGDQVVIVMLRQPTRSDPNESRSDPFYEYGCFGLTGCHETNLLRDTSADGARLAFVQPGKNEIRLVLLTPPARIEWRGLRLVATWTPPEMPLRYDEAPVLVANRIPPRRSSLLDLIEETNRTTPVGKFSSRFRSRKEPLPPAVAAELVRMWETASRTARRATTYVDALPYPPERPLYGTARRDRYAELLRAAGAPMTAVAPTPRRCIPRNTPRDDRTPLATRGRRC